MPVITIDLVVLEKRETKGELVAALTAAASSTTNIPPDKFIVLVNELGKDNIGIGGRLLSDAMK
jgi:4-oxalocrotonate tautomerase